MRNVRVGYPHHDSPPLKPFHEWYLLDESMDEETLPKLQTLVNQMLQTFYDDYDLMYVIFSTARYSYLVALKLSRLSSSKYLCHSNTRLCYGCRLGSSETGYSKPEIQGRGYESRRDWTSPGEELLEIREKDSSLRLWSTGSVDCSAIQGEDLTGCRSRKGEAVMEGATGETKASGER